MAEIFGWMTIADPFANVLYAAAGWDGVVIDAQHGQFDERAMVATLLALPAPRPRRLVRIAANDAALVGKALDSGADGVIVPMVNSAADAVRLAQAAWYAPRGARSFGPALALLRAGSQPYGDFVARQQVLAMIETREALDTVAAIAAVDGITGLFVGPNDLALTLGLPAGSDREEPALLDAFGRVVAAARAQGKTSGIFCASAAYARRMAAIGFDLVNVGTDAMGLASAAAAAVAGGRDAG